MRRIVHSIKEFQFSAVEMARTCIAIVVLILNILAISQRSYGFIEVSERLNYTLPAEGIPESYNLSIEVPDLKSETKFRGKVEIVVRLNPNFFGTKQLTLHAANLTINDQDVILQSISKNNSLGPAVPVTVDLTSKAEQHFLILNTERDIQLTDEKYLLTINYTGLLNHDLMGFYSFPNPNESTYMAVTQFQPTYARLAFPCWDEPKYKANYTISITHHENLTALSNAPAVGDPTPIRFTQRKTTTFETTPKMSTYTVAFAIVNFTHIESEDKWYRVWGRPEEVHKGQYALNTTLPLMNALENYTGIPYNASMKKLDSVAVGKLHTDAMGNWGLITWREYLLLFDENRTSTDQRISFVKTLANKLAHQWFGNLVSPKTWMSVWLSEGFSTYLAYFIVNKIKPEWRLDEIFVTDLQQKDSFAFDAYPHSPPLNVPADSPSDIDNLFDQVPYQKGAVIMRMMEHMLPNNSFQKGVQTYLKNFQYKSVDSEDFVSVFDPVDICNQVRISVQVPRPMRDVMETWLNKPGYPVLFVNNTVGNVVEISQESFLLYGKQSDTKWWVPISFAAKSKPSFDNATPTYWLNPMQNVQTFEMGRYNEWLLVNINQTGYYRVNYDQHSWDQLAQVLHENYETIPPLSRAQLIDDSFAMARTGRLNYTFALGLSLYLAEHETDYVPWRAFFNKLYYLNDRLRYSNKYDIFQSYIRYILRNVTKTVGFQAKENDNDNTKILRSYVMKWSCEAGEKNCTDFAEEKFDTWLNQFPSFVLDADLEEDILCTGVRNLNLELWYKTLNHLKSRNVENNQSSYSQDTIASVMACSNTETIIKHFLIRALDKNFDVPFARVTRSAIEQHAWGTKPTLLVLRNKIDLIKKLYGKGYKRALRDTLTSIANEIVTDDQFKKLAYFMLQENLASDFVADTLQKAYASKLWMDKYLIDIERWLIVNKDMFVSSAN